MRSVRHPHRSAASLGVERLEARQVLATTSLATPPLASLVPVAAPVVAASTVGESVIAVSAVRSANPQFGYDAVLQTAHRGYGYDLAQSRDRVSGSVGVEALDLPSGSILTFEVISGLTFWNGNGQPAFSPVAGTTELSLQAGGDVLRVGGRTDQVGGQPGSVRRSLAVGVADGGSLARSMTVAIGSGGVRDAFARPGAPAGLYAVTGLWSVSGVRGTRDSAPVTLVFSVGGVPASARAAATAFFRSPQGKPSAIVAVAAESISPDGTGQPFLRFTVQFSDPVNVKGTAPRLPVYFDRNARLVALDRDAPRSGVDTLSFTIVPTAAERAASVIRLGESLRLQAGGSLSGSAGGLATPSLPPEATRALPVTLREQVSLITADIAKNTTLRRGTTYVIAGEVHVLRGVTLTIEDGVTVLIRNGRQQHRLLSCNALIFDSGSALKAATVTFAAADATNRPAAVADNGGVFFLGSTRSCSKDGISVDASAATGRSSFSADMVIASFLGRTDPASMGRDDPGRDDIDAISILGMGQTEWRVKGVRSEWSGDDGFDVTRSTITLDSLTVITPVEDGLNVTSSIVDIRRSLTVTMSASRAPDRELFDLEVDTTPARVVIERLAAVDLRGFWGNVYDEVSLNSPDMPAPPRRGGESRRYVFNGILQKGPAIVYSLKAD